jgi:TPR repeat protein
LPTAIYLLGVLSDNGMGVPRDPEAAVEPYRNAAAARRKISTALELRRKSFQHGSADGSV